MFTAVPPDALHSVWGEVFPMLRLTRKKAPDAWIPEDVYREVAEGRAALFLGEGSLLVLIAQKEQFTGIPTLHVWIAFNATDDFDAGIEWVRAHAKQYGFQQITFDSPRPGWAKRFRPVSTRYRLD